MTAGTPPAEVIIDEPLMRGLLTRQYPRLADLPLARIDAGWDNVMFRLGTDLVVRAPRRQAAAQLIVNEQAWLPHLAPRLPIRIPTPVFVGSPDETFPWFWTIGPWIPGRPANLDWPAADQAGLFSAFLRALHHPAPKTAPSNPVRGCPLVDRSSVVEPRCERLQDNLGALGVPTRALWRQALAAAPATKAVWLHGDLHARNVLVDQGVITGVIDWGDITAGDPATDLAAIWSLFEDPAARLAIIADYAPSPDLLARSKGWAVSFGTVLLETGLVDHPLHATMGRLTLERLVADG